MILTSSLHASKHPMKTKARWFYSNSCQAILFVSYKIICLHMEENCLALSGMRQSRNSGIAKGETMGEIIPQCLQSVLKSSNQKTYWGGGDKVNKSSSPDIKSWLQNMVAYDRSITSDYCPMKIQFRMREMMFTVAAIKFWKIFINSFASNEQSFNNSWRISWSSLKNSEVPPRVNNFFLDWVIGLNFS